MTQRSNTFRQLTSFCRNRPKTFAVMVVLMLGPLVTAGFADTRTVAQKEVAWAKQQKQDVPLETFETLQTVSGRKALGRTQTPAHMAELWAEHFERIKARPETTPEQAAFLDSALAAVSKVTVYANSSEVPEELKNLCAKAGELFPGGSQALSILGSIPEDIAAMNTAANSGRFGWKVGVRSMQRVLFASLNADGEDCTCAVGNGCPDCDNENCWSGQAGSGNKSCEEWGGILGGMPFYGCGCMWSFTCDGLCTSDGGGGGCSPGIPCNG